MRVLIVIFAAIACLITGLYFWAQIINAKEQRAIKPYITYTRLIYLAEGCDKFKAQYGAWPASMAQLQTGRPELTDPWDKDAWGRKITFIPYDRSLGYGQLLSYGSNGKVGGAGAEKDLVIRFPSEANSNWNQQIGAGLQKPRFNP